MERRDDDRDLETPLGISDEPIAKTGADQLPENPNPSGRRRRARALGEDGIERQSSGLGDVDPDADGMSGIDMGYGGDGTNVKRGR